MKTKKVNSNSYLKNEDIYNNSKEEKEIDPEDISKKKESNGNYKSGTWNEKDFKNNESGHDLDVPGSELDDIQEEIGSEDEENNNYSLGGDNHSN